MSGLSRRAFFEKTAAGATAFAAGAGLALGATRKKKLPIGVQLYSVRDTAPKDVAGTLAGIKKLGYDGVEFAGYYNNDAKTMRKLLDDNGLRCCGSHVALPTMVGDALQKTIEFNQILGNRYLVVPSMPKEYSNSIEAWTKSAALFNEIAAKLKRQKLHVGFHNHTVEFQPKGGQVPWGVFMGKTSKDVFGQLDIGHCFHGGADPAAVLRKYPRRALTVHAKDWSATKKDALIGEGGVNWPEVLDAIARVGGTQWYIIEEESQAYPGLTGIERSIQNLKKVLA